MATWNNGTKDATSIDLQSKTASTWVQPLRHGKEPTLDALQDYTFTDAPLFNDPTQLQDLTFEQLADQSWTGETKH